MIFFAIVLCTFQENVFSDWCRILYKLFELSLLIVLCKYSIYLLLFCLLQLPITKGAVLSFFYNGDEIVNFFMSFCQVLLYPF